MSLPIPAGTYGIDAMHSQLGFSITHLGISIVRGTFDKYEGSLIVGASLAETAVAIHAEMASINSGNAMRDGHMHGDDFFDVANHPTMSFQSTSIEESDPGYSMTGDLTIKGITHSVTLAADYNGSEVFPMDQSTHFGFAARGTISRSAFGVSYGVAMVSDDVKLTLDVQFVKPAG